MDIRLRGMNELTTLFLAREVAVADGRSPGEAVRACAARIRDRVFYYPELERLCADLARAEPMAALKSSIRLEARLRALGGW